MERFEFPIKILTPIWTAGSSGKPEGLKMSGVMGSMRHAFEMLVRKHGGHTCNITGTDATKRCNYANNKKICPACRLFGCTGLSSAFKIVLDLDTVKVVFPETDKYLPNRDHNNKPYNTPPSIDTWLATIIKGGDTIHPENHDIAKQEIKNLALAFSTDETKIKILGMREWSSEISLESLLKSLFLFMSRYSGLGAKVRQGWGQFEIPNTTYDRKREEEIFKRLIEERPFHSTDWDKDLPNAKDCFFKEFEISNNELGFKWPRDEECRDRFKCVGFGLQYALRRQIKFFGSPSYSQQKGLPITNEWRSIRLQGKWNTVLWKEAIAFTRALFGRDEASDKDKQAGLIGVSHVYKDGNQSKIKLFGHIPEKGMYDGKVYNWDKDKIKNFVITEFEKNLRKRAPGSRRIEK